MCFVKAFGAAYFPWPIPPQMFLRLFPLQLVIQLFHCLKYYYTKDHHFSIKKRLLLLLKSQKIMQNGFCLTFFSLFPLEKRRIKKSFSSPASSWVLFFFCLAQWGFCFSAENPVIFQRLLCTTILPVVLLTQHILQELMSKRLSLLSLSVFYDVLPPNLSWTEALFCC